MKKEECKKNNSNPMDIKVVLEDLIIKLKTTPGLYFDDTLLSYGDVDFIIKLLQSILDAFELKYRAKQLTLTYTE